MKKQTKHQYDNMMQVYRKMHEEVAQLAQQVLELEDEEYNLPSDILYEVNDILYKVSNILYEVSEKLYGHYNFVADIDWLLKLNDTRKFLIVCLMFLNDYIGEADMYEAFNQYLDKNKELNS